MATELVTQMSFEERALFLPSMTVQAMRDSRYRHPALAVAELIDNSLDARSSQVDILIREHQVRLNQRTRWRVAELAVIDNGHGMSSDTLVQALRFGGRQPSGSVHQIGKYGMGLPTASVSQCKRVDVWTWDHSIDQCCHSYIDIKQIEAGTQQEVPEPDSFPIPKQWLDIVSSSTLNPEHGTLVVWTEPDRVVAQSSTIFDQVEEQIGRIYRRYIDEKELKIRMASFRQDESGPQIDRIVRPNDPMYLMEDSSTPEPWDATPMFRPYATKEFTLNVDGREESVEVVYSIAKREALGERMGHLPGNTNYGRHARKNMGISVVREDREILLEHFFNVEGGGGSLPQNRWWGCEVRFGSGCDDLFGVDHNKQMVSYFSRAVRDTAEGEGESRQQTLDDLGVGENDIYAVVSHIRGTVKNMMNEIDRMFAARPGRSVGPDTNGSGRSVEQTAVNLTTGVTRHSIEDDGSKPTQTDRDRAELDTQERTTQLASHLVHQGLSEPEAQYQAVRIVQNDDWFSIVPTQLTGSQMFSFVSRGGVLNMSLNIHHPIYRFLQVIETEAAESGNEVARRAAVGILAMLLSWGRMEDDIERDDIRLQVQDRAIHWGRMVSGVLGDLEIRSAIVCLTIRSDHMTILPWDALLERCTGATEAVIVAPYIKVGPLTTVLDQLGTGASVECFTRWIPVDIQVGASDLDCRTAVIDRGGAFRLHNRLHAKYYRFDDRVLVGSANMTASGLGYPRHGNLEILCEPGTPFVPAVFEAVLRRESRMVSDDDFRLWQQCPAIERGFLPSIADSGERSLDEWKPQARNPDYLWLCYCGNEDQIVSGEQRALASLDLRILDVPLGLTPESFRDWIRLSLEASPFVDTVRNFGSRSDSVVWDSVAAQWGVNRSMAARWVSTAQNWLRFFDYGQSAGSGGADPGG